MNNYRKWILCGVGWLLLYVYFDPGLFTFFIHTVWRLWSMSSEERHFWQPRFRYWPRSVSQLSSGMYVN